LRKASQSGVEERENQKTRGHLRSINTGGDVKERTIRSSLREGTQVTGGRRLGMKKRKLGENETKEGKMDITSTRTGKIFSEGGFREEARSRGRKDFS